MISDIVAKRCFHQNKEAVELILSIIFHCDMKLTCNPEIQVEFKYSKKTRGACLDLVAISGNHVFNIELENNPNRKRIISNSRYYQKVAGIKYSHAKTNKNDSNDIITSVIYLCKTDLFFKKQKYYSCNLTRGTYCDIPSLEEDSIVYINTNIQDDSALGKLCFDLNCSDPSKMHYQPLKECLLALRRNQEEVDAMCYEVMKIAKKEAKIAAKKAKVEGFAAGKKEGLKQGFNQGIIQGNEQGITQGMKLGMKQKALKVLERLLDHGERNLDLLTYVTDLNQDTIIKIAKQKKVILQ